VEEITFLAAGDCGPVSDQTIRFPARHYTELVQPVLDQADLKVVNCMRTYSDRGVQSELAPQVQQSPEMAKIFTEGGFSAVNFANNHIFDSGAEAMLDTRDLMLRHGVQVTGAGANLDEARQPALLKAKGITVAYLGSCSTGHHGSDAGPNKPGISTMRIRTAYETHGPHAPVRVRTEPNQRDLNMLLEDIAAARGKADVVVVALHYGIIRVPRVVPDYHVTVARACIDAGADLVVGHSPHVPKGIEVYRGKVIFYSLGVFSMTKPFPSPTWKEPAWAQGTVRNHTDLDPDYPFMPYGRDSTMSVLAKAVVSKSGLQRVSFLPMMMDRQYRTEVLRRSDVRFGKVLRYMDWASEDFAHQFTVHDDEVVVTA
jgi:poly-gamma-glutamate synthesis protein (capsule biosynthesis protein)